MSDPYSLDAGALPAKPFLRVPISLYYFDTDAGGVVHNVAYLRLIEVARSQLAEHLGWPLGQMDQSGIVPVVARTEVDYLAPARLGDDLVIEARVLKLERVRFYLGFEMIRLTDNKRLISCRQTMAVVNVNTMRPHRLPTSWTERYPELR